MVGSGIKKLRKKKKLTQKELAEKLGVSRQALCMWEADKRELKATALRKIAKVFRVPVDQIINYSTDIMKERNDDMKRKTKKIKAKFSLTAPEAKNVFLTGSFNSWNPKSLPMKKSKKGEWKTSLDCAPGRYEYKFVVDDQWWNDPVNNSTVTNSYGSVNSVVDINK